MAFKKIITANQDLNRVQDNVGQALSDLQSAPLSGGQIQNSVPLVVGPNQVAHKLGRQPTQWMITDLSAASIVYRGSWDSNFITLNASVDCTINLWVT